MIIFASHNQNSLQKGPSEERRSDEKKVEEKKVEERKEEKPLRSSRRVPIPLKVMMKEEEKVCF